MYPAWVGERLFIRPGLEEKYLSGLALRKVVYSAWVGERLFIWPSSEKS